MLEPLHESVWVVAKPFKMLRQDMGVRMTVLRLANGDLWLHSPVKMTSAEHDALTALGPVAHVVAPNLMHHLALPEYSKRYPMARFYGARGLDRKRRDIPFSETLSRLPPPSWRQEIATAEIEGVPKLNEFVFFHRPSRTLIVTDLAFNLGAFPTLLGRLLAKLNDCENKLGPTRVFRLLIKNRAKLAASVKQVLAWDFDRLIVSHGNIVDKDAKPKLEAAFAFLLH
jgi:hypothetical protein